MIQITFRTDGIVKALATCKGPVRIYSTDLDSLWPVPDEDFVLWGTQPENTSKWYPLAVRAKKIVGWNTRDIENLDESLRAKVCSILEYTGSAEVASLFCTGPPTLVSFLRERGFNASIKNLGLPFYMTKISELQYNPDLDTRVRAVYDSLVNIGRDEYNHDLDQCFTIQTYCPEPGTVVANNTGHPVMLTALLLLKTHHVVIQMHRSGHINVQSDGSVILNPNDYFEPGTGGGSDVNMGGHPRAKYNFDGAGTTNLRDLLNSDM
jgi:hypothetical protein